MPLYFLTATLCACLAVLFFNFLVILKPQRRAAFVLLGVTLSLWGGVEIADLYLVYHPAHFYFWKKWVLLGEALLPGCCLLVAFSHFHAGAFGAFSPVQRLLLAAATLPVLAALLLPSRQIFFSPDFGVEWILFLGQSGYLIYLSITLLLLIALTCLGQSFFLLGRDLRRRLRLEFVGIGLLPVTLIIYYSQPLIYRSIDMSLVPIRPGMMLLGLALILGSRLRRRGGVSLRLSHGATYHSAAFFVAGIYLALIGLVSQGLSWFSFRGQRYLFILVCIGLGLLFISLLVSDRVRRRFRVFLHKHFVRSRYDYRQEWLGLTRQLAGARTVKELRQTILQAFAGILDAEDAQLFVRQGDEGFFCSCRLQKEVRAEPVAADHPVFQWIREEGWVVDLRPYRDELPEAFLQDSALLIPLQFESRLEAFVVLGSLLSPDEELTYEEFDMMKAMAAQSTASLLSLHLSEQLAVERELAAIGKVSTFVLHDLKNLLSSMQMVVSNAERHLDNPEFRLDMLATIKGNSDKMQALIQRLGSLRSQLHLHCSPSDLVTIIQGAVARSGVSAILKLPERLLAYVDAGELGKVLDNLLLNAFEAGADRIEVQAEATPEICIQVVDNGAGMEESFVRSRLFRPFETTKKKGSGIGLYQSRTIVRAHGGRLDVRSVPGEGSCFRICLPARTAEGVAEVLKES